MKTVDEYMAMLTEPLSAEKVRDLVDLILGDAQDAIRDAVADASILRS